MVELKKLYSVCLKEKEIKIRKIFRDITDTDPTSI